MSRALPLLLAGSLALAQGPRDPVRTLGPLLGIPYAEDAVQDEAGAWTRFADPSARLPGPGLNCSGFLVTAARRLLGYRGSPAEAARDRLGDSGPGAAAGQDWDFGWDLVLNLSEGHPRRWVLPEGERPAPGAGARALAGFRVQDPLAWATLRPRLRAGRVYLATFLRGAKSLRHHHVALLLVDRDGRLWLYQTLPMGRVHRLNLDDPAGFQRLCAMFGPGERLLLLETE